MYRWTVADVSKDPREDVTDEDGKAVQIDLYETMGHLQPYKQYAVYVKAYMTSSATIGAQSDMLYFTTKAISEFFVLY